MTSVNFDPNNCEDGLVFNKWWRMPIAMALIVPLTLVRQIKKFAWTHIFVDFAVTLSVIVICFYATQNVVESGFKSECIEKIGVYWPSGIGFALFSYEGIAIIIPIKEIVEDKRNYTKVVIVAIGLYGMINIAFGEYGLFGFGAAKSKLPLVTENLPRKGYVTWTIKMLYCVVAIVTYPLIIYPITQIIDSYTTDNW